MSEEIKNGIEEKIKNLQAVKDSGSREEIEAKLQELSAELSKIGEAIQNSAKTDQTKPEESEAGEDVK